MARLSDEEIIEIRNKVDIVDVIGSYIPLIQKGKNFFGLCPFHDDHNPSMSVSPTKQIYKCFVCGAVGNVFTFLMDYEHLNFIEAVKLMADKAGIKISLTSKVNTYHSKSDEKYYQMYDLANKFYQHHLHTTKGKKAYQYLIDRLFTDEIIKTFAIGLAAHNHQIVNLLKDKGYTDEEIIDSGLGSLKDNHLYDLFVNRIIFPLWDLEGKVVAFSGRLYESKDDFGPKYINSKETKVFKKSHLLYNYHLAKNEIRKKKKVIVVEGFMDVIALYKVGLKNVVATMGTAVTEEQVNLLKRLSSNVILCFDGDQAGEQATYLATSLFSQKGLSPKIIRLEDNLDPDDYLKQYGVTKFNKLLNKPMSLIDFKMNFYRRDKDLTNSDDLTQYIKEVIEALVPLKDPILNDLTLKKLSDETGVLFNTLNDTLKNKIAIDKKMIKEKHPKQLYSLINKYQKAEQRMLYYMLKNKEVITIYESHKCFFPSQIYRYLVNEIMFFYRRYQVLEIADFITYLGEKKELLDALKQLLNLDLPEHYSKEEIYDYIEILNQAAINEELKRLNDLFKVENDLLVKAGLANQIASLRKRSMEND